MANDDQLSAYGVAAICIFIIGVFIAFAGASMAQVRFYDMLLDYNNIYLEKSGKNWWFAMFCICPTPPRVLESDNVSQK